MSSKKKAHPVTPSLPEKKLEKVVVMLRYDFTERELKERGDRIAQSIKKKASVEDELKSIKADYKQRMENINGELNELSNAITQRYEMRNTPCFLHKNFKQKERQYINQDGEILKVEPLTIADMQLAIDIADKK